MKWFKKQKERYGLEVVFNCYCLKCKKNKAERIKVGEIGFIGFDCSCGFKKKANLKKIDYFSNNLFSVEN